jgi:formylglycine-generating enzyme required for sulfatase activity
MKKTVLFFVLATVVVLSIITGCKSNPPSAPGAIATNTPNGTETYIALYTRTITPTHTVSPTTTATPSITNTVTITQTATVTATASTTATITETSTATVTATSTSTVDSSALVSVTGGTFTQTDTSANSFSHTISTFKIGKYEVTYELWYTVYQWAIANGYTFAYAGSEGIYGTIGAAPTAAKYQPVTSVNCRDVIVWCNAYSEMSSLTPAYCSNASYITPIKISTNYSVIETAPGTVDNPYVNWSANGYRLPTEGEWQYAASYIDGTSWTPYNYASGATADYTNVTATGLVAWYNANCSSTQAVGGKTANALGIYDMSGNVYEWCWDWYGTYPGTSTDYRGPVSGSVRVMRGGNFDGFASYLQVGNRNTAANPCSAFGSSGFRFARTN